MSRKVDIVVVGGGSGGHLTPLIAVARSIKELNANKKVAFIGQKNEDLGDVLKDNSVYSAHAISAGKFRRYHGESLVSHLLDVKTVALNIRDLFRFIKGTVEAWFLLGRLKPKVIWLKGGFVSVPVGIAARLRKIPYATHDSDAIPGLANRLTAKRAFMNMTAMPADIYPYPASKAVQVGIPLRPEFKLVTKQSQSAAKKSFGLNSDDKVLVSVGGGLGAQKLNRALMESASDLLTRHKTLHIFQLTGKKLYKETEAAYSSSVDKKLLKRVHLVDFALDFHRYSTAADIVVTRAGATNIAELAVQGKACVIVPNPVLTGGQQLHNAKFINQSDAAVVVDEQDVSEIGREINALLDDETRTAKLQGNIQKMAHYESSGKIATILIEESSRAV